MMESIPTLSAFHISETTGFLLEDPLVELPSPFKQWVVMCHKLPELLKERKLREKVAKLPVLDDTALKKYKELRLAHLVLAFITQGYVWQEGDKGAVNRIPAALAVPLWNVSRRLGVQPIVSHIDAVLSNWKKIDPEGPLEIRNLRSLFVLPGGRHCEWFFLVTVQIELDCVKGIKAVISAMNNVQFRNNEGLIEDLIQMVETFHKVKSSLALMHENLSAEVFYTEIRPFLAGFGGESSPLPDGIIFEGINEHPIKLTGGSAAQSSPIQCFDVALGVEHEPEKQKFLVQMREHMPPSHKGFIEEIEKKSCIRRYVESCGDLNLLGAYNNAIKALKDMRSYHIQIVAKFIVSAASKARKTTNYESLSKKGTGGQDLIPFLKSIRNTTEDASIKK